MQCLGSPMQRPSGGAPLSAGFVLPEELVGARFASD